MLACPDCGKFELIKRGRKSGKQDYECLLCGRRTVNPIEIQSRNVDSDIKLNEKDNVLIIGDTHIPFEHKDYLNFVSDVGKKYDCKTIIHIGDLVDNHAISYHEKDPDGYNAGAEFEVAKNKLAEWVKVFPKMYIATGNHDMLPTRKAKTHGLPRILFKDYNTIWDLPDTWYWDLDYEVNGVKYMHGTGKSGQYMHVNWAKENMQPTVTGHGHSVAGVEFMASRKQRIYAMGVGCGLAIKSYAIQYGETFARRPVLGCGVVLEEGTQPIFIPMKLE